MESGDSLIRISDDVRAQLRRLDNAAAESYLSGILGIVAPHREMIESARFEMTALAARATMAESTSTLRSINDQAVELATDLFNSLQSVPMVQEVCTDVRDVIAERALALARRELYFSGMSCDLPLALLSVGSDGRREQSLITDQDYLFVHGAGAHDDVQSEEVLADYFAMLGSVFVDIMDEIGISRCSGGMMPVNADWRGTPEQWHERLTLLFRFERADWEKNILTLIALVDTRFVCGDRELGAGFGAAVRSRIRETPEAIRHMARVVSSMKLSKGFLKRFIVEAEEPHKGEFNIKILAWMPLVMCVRLLAVDVGIEETSTVARLRRMKEEGHLTPRLSADLMAAYHTITRHRIQQQIRRIKRIIDYDCYLNPYELPNPERQELKAANDAIEELQNQVRGRFFMTTSVEKLLSAGRS